MLGQTEILLVELGMVPLSDRGLVLGVLVNLLVVFSQGARGGEFVLLVHGVLLERPFLLLGGKRGFLVYSVGLGV